MDCLNCKQQIENTLNSLFFELDAQRRNVGVSFLLLSQNMLYLIFHGRFIFSLFPYKMLLEEICGCWVQSIWRRLGAKYMPFGCISDTAESLPDSR